ncbi:MAG: hypothetical protein LBR51_03795 [Bacteroidales bacterium]|jgi:hypothetical protein|nr:hypothetical protein [Bacteroidales bacterium]
MKQILFALFMSMLSCSLYAQSCIDYVMLDNHIEHYNARNDTLFCKILSEDEFSYVIDNGQFVSTLSKTVVAKVEKCAREMTPMELYRFKGIDQVTQDYFDNANTAGAYLRSAAFHAFWATGLGLVGSSAIVLGISVFKDHRSSPYWIAGGSIVSAGSLFFLMLAWNNVYKAGKILDINKKIALHWSPTSTGTMGLNLRF